MLKQLYSYNVCELKNDHTQIYEYIQFSLNIYQDSESKPRASNFENKNRLH